MGAKVGSQAGGREVAERDGDRGKGPREGRRGRKRTLTWDTSKGHGREGGEVRKRAMEEGTVEVGQTKEERTEKGRELSPRTCLRAGGARDRADGA